MRSDSDRTEKPDDYDEDGFHHPVEPRKMTALLPPIMVRPPPLPFRLQIGHLSESMRQKAQQLINLAL
jgi:hypothetical protein